MPYSLIVELHASDLCVYDGMVLLPKEQFRKERGQDQTGFNPELPLLSQHITVFGIITLLA